MKSIMESLIIFFASSIALFACRPPSPNLVSPIIGIESSRYKLCIHYYVFISLQVNLPSSSFFNVFVVCKYFYHVFLHMGAIDQLPHQVLLGLVQHEIVLFSKMLKFSPKIIDFINIVYERK